MPKLIQSLCFLLVIFLRAAPNAALLPFTWIRQQCWTLTLPSFSQQGQALGLSYISGVTLSPLLMFNQLPALHWWHQNQNCYWWSELPLDCISWIQMETELSILTPGSILIPKRRNSAAFLRERRNSAGVHVWSSVLREWHCQKQSSAIFLLHWR